VAPPDWLERGMAYCQRADLWGGAFKAEPEGIFNRATYAILHFPDREQFGTKDRMVDIPGTNLFVNKEAFAKLGGFMGKRGCQDLEFIQRAQVIGLRVLYVPDLYVFHPWNFTLISYFKRILAFKTGKRHLKTERNRKYLLIFFITVFLMLSYIVGYKITLALVAGCLLTSYGYFLLKYLRRKIPPQLSALCATLRIAIITMGALAYLHILSHKKYWK